jgi:hypothetical protein
VKTLNNYKSCLNNKATLFGQFKNVRTATSVMTEFFLQIVTSAHYMLSDLYVPADTDPASPGLDGPLNDEEDCENSNQSGMEDDGKSGVDDNLFEGTGSLKHL